MRIIGTFAVTAADRAGRKRLRLILAAVAGALASRAPAYGLVINPTFDSTITTGLSPATAAQWESAINYADLQYENLFTDPISINITFAAGSGLGSSSTNLQYVANSNNSTYAAMKSALAADSKSANDATAVANLPATDPTGGGSFIVSTAEAKALGLSSGTGSDGTITLGTGNPYTFDPNNRAVPGDYDFIGVAEHEISEVMGRIGILGSTLGTGQALYDPLDLFGYTGPGALDIKPNQASVYFSINGGHTLLKLYNNGSNGGDNKDWGSGFSPDSYDAFATLGAKEDISAVDKIEMDVIGYDPAPPKNLTWNTVGGTWNTVSTNQPWLNGSNPSYYNDGDTANFTNAAVGSVTIDSGGVSPGATNVSNSSGTYTFSGGGILSGALTKTNGGTLTLSNSKNAFTSVTLSGGTLDVESNGSGSTLPANISITNNASLIINDSAATTASQIAGTGSTTIGPSGKVTVGTLNQAGVTNNGTLSVTTTGAITSGITGTGSTTIAATATGVTTFKVVQNSLTVNGALKITAGNGPQAPDHTSVVSSLTVSGGLLDLTEDAMVVHAGSPSAAATAAAAINTQIALGAHNTGSGSTYLGTTGITSSTLSGGSLSPNNYGVGVAANSAGMTSFGGQSVGSGDVLVGLTLLGDADMSGTVDSNDLNNLLNHYNQTGTTWQEGDFNYDGTTNSTDLNLLLNNYNQSLVYGTSAINAVSDHLDAPAIQMLEARGFTPREDRRTVADLQMLSESLTASPYLPQNGGSE